MYKGAVILASGSIAAQVITFLATPIITRIYSPDDFGFFALFISIISVLGVLSALRYDNALPLSNGDEERPLLKISILINLIYVAFIFLIFALDLPILNQYLADNGLKDFWYLIAVGILINGFHATINYLGVKQKLFVEISKSKIIQSIILLGSQLIGFNFGGIALVISYILGQFSFILFLAKKIKNNINNTNTSMTHCMKKYRKFPLYSTPEGLVNTFSAESVVLIGSLYFSSFFLGVYILVNKLIALPAGMISGSISQSFYVHGAEAKREGSISILTSDLINKIIKLITLPAFLGLIIGPDMVPIIFGNQYTYGSNLIAFIIVWVYFQTLSATLTPLISIYNVQNIGLIWNLFLFLIRIFSIVIAIHYENFLLLIMLFSLTSAFSYIILFIWMVKLSECSLKKILSENIKYYLQCLPLLVLALPSISISLNINLLEGCIIISCLGYFFYTWIKILRESISAETKSK